MKKRLVFPIESDKQFINSNSYSAMNKNPIKHKKHETRYDKTYPRKFPVKIEDSIALRNLYLSLKSSWSAKSITQFLTMMVRYGLRHPEIIQEEQEYQDTEKYKTIKLNSLEMKLIGGEDGLAIVSDVSERRMYYRIVFSVYHHLVRMGGRVPIEEIKSLEPSAFESIRRTHQLYKISLSAKRTSSKDYLK